MMQQSASTVEDIWQNGEKDARERAGRPFASVHVGLGPPRMAH
jgi:hypothetical protein